MVKVTLLPSSLRGHPHHQFASSYRINTSIAVDAGTLGYVGTPEQQRQIRHLFLTHVHADHTATLPIFLENVFQPNGDCPTLYASQSVIDAMRQHLFNDVLWPDFIRLSEGPNKFVKLAPFEPGQSVTVDGVKVTATPMSHVVPTQGYVFEDADGAVVLAGDTGPTHAFWQTVAHTPNVRAIILETAFPNRMHQLALIAEHLTPQLLGDEWAKQTAHPEAQLMVVHIKAFARPEILRELADLGLPRMEVMEPDREYTW